MPHAIQLYIYIYQWVEYAPLVSMFTKTEEKFSLLGVVRCFWRVLENYDFRTKVN